MGKGKKPIHIKNFGGTPPGLCPVCPVDMSQLSRGPVPSVPRTFCPLNVNFHINRPKRPGCPWDVPNLSPGRSRGIPTTKFLYSMPDVTGRPGAGRWKGVEEAPRRTSRVPLASPYLCFFFIGLETKNILDFQGRAGSTSIVQWTLRPVTFGVDLCDFFLSLFCYPYISVEAPEIPFGLLSERFGSDSGALL